MLSRLSTRPIASQWRLLVILFTTICALPAEGTQAQQIDREGGWGKIRSVHMSGGLRAFWNVGGPKEHSLRAYEHGFEPVGLLGAYNDYPGKQERNIGHYIKDNAFDNPWAMPDYFSEIVGQNCQRTADSPRLKGRANVPMVLDIEFRFEQSAEKAWTNDRTRAASGSKNLKEFQHAYHEQWAKWFWLPCSIGKRIAPNMMVGLYGVQPFRRDYWGISGKDAQQIDGSHQSDAELWSFIDPYVDFYIASIYVFYKQPGSVFYIAANVEENVKRTRQFGDKPVYSYSWLKFHPSNKKLKGKELPAWLADATAVVPYFYGAKGNVLWGWEPKASGYRPLYRNLKVYTDSLGRVADLADKIAIATPAPDDAPAHVLWKEKRPLLKRLKVSDDEWFILACNPWQTAEQTSPLKVKCGRFEFTLTLEGKHCDIFHFTGDEIRRLQVNYAR